MYFICFRGFREIYMYKRHSWFEFSCRTFIKRPVLSFVYGCLNSTYVPTQTTVTCGSQC